MGVNHLWDLLGNGERQSLAKLASDHYRRTGKTYKVAIDEACWRYSNLSDAQTDAIRPREPRANPIEKAILYQILRLLRLNFELVFVFDGPARPWKRGRRGGNRVDYERTKLLKTILDHIRVPWLEAPGDAEAECATLQRLGLVDAVWSEDGDTLVFGATRMFSFCRSSGEKTGGKDPDHVMVTQLTTASLRHGGKDIDSRLLVLFALLTGGDYDQHGLSGFGCARASALILTNKGRQAADELFRSNFDLTSWRKQVVGAILQNHYMHLDPSWPNPMALKHYVHPKASPETRLHTWRASRSELVGHPNEHALRRFLMERFNFDTKAYARHVLPVLLVRQLRNATSADSASAVLNRCEATVKKKKIKVGTSGATASPKDFVRKVCFRSSKVGDVRLFGSPYTTPPEEQAFAEAEILSVLLERACGTMDDPALPKHDESSRLEAAKKEQERQAGITYLMNIGRSKTSAQSKSLERAQTNPMRAASRDDQRQSNWEPSHPPCAATLKMRHVQHSDKSNLVLEASSLRGEKRTASQIDVREISAHWYDAALLESGEKASGPKRMREAGSHAKVYSAEGARCPLAQLAQVKDSSLSTLGQSRAELIGGKMVEVVDLT
ncbi:Flap endonuclease GEN 1 [Sphaceloma murrayae]|uniref:Flap endonuclease GEN 1 n=1 Tax=Sphaceloma murrayae TaxID=2082308 RepID=A0A2K1R020_9PEZI|nr:Flap endonuclease GEN 1 [Sphaceloma murrayae]